MVSYTRVGFYCCSKEEADRMAKQPGEETEMEASANYAIELRSPRGEGESPSAMKERQRLNPSPDANSAVTGSITLAPRAELIPSPPRASRLAPAGLFAP